MAWNSQGSPLPTASLHLLVPPVRLLSAFIFQVVKQHSVMQFDKVADFVTLATEIVPELLSLSQRALLIMNLRARLVLELCRSDGIANLRTIQGHLDKIHACCAQLSSTEKMDISDSLTNSYANFACLIQKLLNVPYEKEMFFQDLFPEIFDSKYDQRLQHLMYQFLSKLEQLLPIPDLQKTAAWLTETSSTSEDLGQHLSDPFALTALLAHHRQLENLSSANSSSDDDNLWSTLALPGPSGFSKYTESYGDDGGYDNEEIMIIEDLEEDLSQCSTVTEDDWMPNKKRGRSPCSFVCPQRPFSHSTKKQVQEHMQSTHHITVLKSNAKKPKDNKKKVKGNLGKKIKAKQTGTTEKKQECKQKKENLENKKQHQRKAPTGLDKRFLSTRPVTKNFTEEETKCPKCDKVFELPNQLMVHVKLHSFAYSCLQCEKGFTSLSGYYQHQRVHKRGRKFVCGQCKKGFLCNYSLKQHEQLHKGPSNLCTICGKGFSKSGITRHMQMHKGERNYLCTTCGKSFLSSGELLLHTRSHTGETPYTCTHCGKGFSTKSHLNVHIRSHTGERPYQCTECSKCFVTLNCLRRHMLSHNGVKPFKCPNCDKEFSQQGNMKRHFASHKTVT